MDLRKLNRLRQRASDMEAELRVQLFDLLLETTTNGGEANMPSAIKAGLDKALLPGWERWSTDTLPDVISQNDLLTALGVLDVKVRIKVSP